MITIKAFKTDEQCRLYCEPQKENRYYYETGKTYIQRAIIKKDKTGEWHI